MDSIVEILRELPNKAAALWVNHRRSIGVTASGIAVVAAICSYRAIKRRRRRVSLIDKLGGTTGPIPYLGFVPKSIEHFLYGLEILADTYGDVFATKIMGKDVVVLTDAEAIRGVLKERPHSIIRLVNSKKLLPFSGMFTSEGEDWKRSRRLAAPALNAHHSAQMVPAMAVVGKRLVRQLQGSACDGRVVWEPTEWFMMCTLDILCLTAFGMDSFFLNPDGIHVASKPQEIAQAITDFVEGLTYILQFAAFPFFTRNVFPWKLNPMIRKFHVSVERLNNFADEIAMPRRAAVSESRQADLLTKLLHMDKQDLQGNLVTFFLAGSETTATTLSWCLYYFCLYPDVQARARAEVDTLGRDPETDDDLERLPFVESCILEALRLQPAAPLLVHECTADVSVCGFHLPAGTRIVSLLRKRMRSSAEGGTSFRPQRWLRSDGCVDRARSQEHLGFGSSPRRCPGSYMAIKEGTLILAMILRYFEDFKNATDISHVEAKSKLTFRPEKLEISMARVTVEKEYHEVSVMNNI